MQRMSGNQHFIMLALLIVLVFTHVEVNVHALDHDLHDHDENCTLCLVGVQLDSAALTAPPLIQPAPQSDTLNPGCVCLADIIIPLCCYQARAPPFFR